LRCNFEKTIAKTDGPSFSFFAATFLSTLGSPWRPMF